MSYLRILGGLICLGFLVAAMTPLLVLLIPFRVARIKVTNAFGTAIGKTVMWWSGSKISVEGHENVRAERPAIYMANHTSLFDAFTTIWLTPSGTVGVAKKEVLYYPFYGQAWWLAGHVFLDRGRTERAKRSMQRATDFITEHGLHLCILPEGTRSTSGRLLPFKKGIVHVALATKLPIVPMVTIGAHTTWKKATLSLQKADIRIKFLPPIPTDSWTPDRIEEHVEELRRPFLETLPPSQQPE